MWRGSALTIMSHFVASPFSASASASSYDEQPVSRRARPKKVPPPIDEPGIEQGEEQRVCVYECECVKVRESA